jgi:hypothetical protein
MRRLSSDTTGTISFSDGNVCRVEYAVAVDDEAASVCRRTPLLQVRAAEAVNLSELARLQQLARGACTRRWA